MWQVWQAIRLICLGEKGCVYFGAFYLYLRCGSLHRVSWYGRGHPGRSPGWYSLCKVVLLVTGMAGDTAQVL